MNRFSAAALAVAIFIGADGRAQDSLTLATVLDRVHGYLLDYANRLPATIASEHYVQRAGSGATGKAVTLDSDFGIVRLPGFDQWVGFRDVLRKDGAAVGDRVQRMEALFLKPPGDRLRQVELIAQESARHNIGPVTRTINNPALVLELLDGRNAFRMRFEKSREETFEKVPVWIIRFEEIVRPTIVRSADSSDVPARGRAWVDPATGTVLRVEATISSVGRTGTFNCTTDVTFRLDPKLGFWVPARMDEEYLNPRFVQVSSGQATYSNYRQFAVDTQESLIPIH
jgi:hypothetical protein